MIIHTDRGILPGLKELCDNRLIGKAVSYTRKIPTPHEKRGEVTGLILGEHTVLLEADWGDGVTFCPTMSIYSLSITAEWGKELVFTSGDDAWRFIL